LMDSALMLLHTYAFLIYSPILWKNSSVLH
jgi:hypothetical protein